MKNNSLSLVALLSAVALFCFSRSAWPQGFQITPPPLAKAAKAKPDEFPEQRAQRDLDANYVRMNILIGSGDYDTLEKVPQEWLAQYRAKKIDGSQYHALLNTLAPSNAGKGMLNDVLAWTRTRPKSYFAWYALGRLYYDLAWQERGEKYASQTTAARFEAMDRYVQLSREAYKKSVKLTDTPQASYEELIRIASITNRPAADSIELLKSALTPQQKRFCPASYATNGPYSSTFEEQLYYLCLALKSDPNAVGSFGAFAFYNSPRWGGNYERVDKVLEEIAGDKRTETSALGRMRAELLANEAWDAALANDHHRSADLYLKAFRSAPMPEHVKWMYWAANQERDDLKNLDRALVLYTEIAAYRPGEYEAIGAIGWIYEEKGDLRKYMENMTVAATLGMKEAQNNLGYYYMVGQRGLPRDLQQAREWLTLAANQGFEHAREKLGVVDAMITKEKSAK